MAVRLARHARRQLRLARDRHRLPQPVDPAVILREQPRQETSPLASLVAHLTHRLSRFQGIHTLITFGGLFAFWLPSVVDSSFRRSLKSAGSVEHLLSLSNITQPSSTPLVFGFIDEFWLQFLVVCGYAAVAGLSVLPHQLQVHLPNIETINHSRLLLIFCRSILPLIFSPIVGQLVSGFVDRPLDMLADFRVNSFFIVQVIGYLLCLFSSFIIGVTYASVHQSEASLGTS